MERKTMRRYLGASALTCVCALFFCSCATEHSAHCRLPATVSMSKDAGRKKLLVVTVRLENGEKLPMALDTGAEGTCFDKSLEPKLGKRLDTGECWNFGVRKDAGVYAPPRLFLGNVPLPMTSTKVSTIDLKGISYWDGPPVSVLGMDILKNYCIQLDFAANQIRFLDSEQADKKNWGQPFPLIDSGDGCFYIDDNLAGVKGAGSLIDTGYDRDGWLTPNIFQQWTNHALSPGKDESRSPNGALGGEIYHELDLHRLANGLETNDSHMKLNGIGLHVLSENLVTLDFPRRTLYLKRTSKWPLYDKSLVSDGKWEAKPVIKLLKTLKEKGQLPGWSKQDQWSDEDKRLHFQYDDHILDSVGFDVQKKDNASFYHYTFSRTSKNSPWALQKAWQTDKDGATLTEYPVPPQSVK